MLLIMTHPALPDTLFFVNNYANIVSNGITFIAWPFDLPMPEIGSDTLPQLTLTIDNVDRRIGESIKAIQTPIDVEIMWVLASNPDQIEGGPLFLRMMGTETTLQQISGSLNFEDLLNEPFPYNTYNPGNAPGLF